MSKTRLAIRTVLALSLLIAASSAACLLWPAPPPAAFAWRAHLEPFGHNPAQDAEAAAVLLQPGIQDELNALLRDPDFLLDVLRYPEAAEWTTRYDVSCPPPRGWISSRASLWIDPNAGRPYIDLVVKGDDLGELLRITAGVAAALPRHVARVHGLHVHVNGHGVRELPVGHPSPLRQLARSPWCLALAGAVAVGACHGAIALARRCRRPSHQDPPDPPPESAAPAPCGIQDFPPPPEPHSIQDFPPLRITAVRPPTA